MTDDSSILSTGIIAITKNGITIARTIKEKMPEAEIYAPAKHSDSGNDINWFSEQTSHMVAELFRSCDALICIFSLGAVIRLISPFLIDKKSDPAVLVIDDRANFVISTLSGHLGGANNLSQYVASILGSKAVITTAADVNQTIAVDLIGKEFGWEIENYQNVTKVSAFMVNEEKIAIYQDAGEKNWLRLPSLPKNVAIVDSIEKVKDNQFKGSLIITDKAISDDSILEKSVIYRPKSLVAGIGLHWDTSDEVIESGLVDITTQKGLSLKCIRNIASLNRGATAKGLAEFSKRFNIPVQLYDKASLALISVPNPSETVQRFEGTASVSEAASLLSSGGEIVIPKQKYPPNLTIAISRVKFD
jgi:cobalt-precorrin 5A hydrolase